MGSLTKSWPAEAYEIAGIRVLQECLDPANSQCIEDTLYPLLAMSVLTECGGLNGQPAFARVMEIAAAIPSRESAASFLTRAAGGFARCLDIESAAELLEAAALTWLNESKS